MAKKTMTIEDLFPDNKNFNKGTQYGQHLIEESLRKFGAGRSILIDKHNNIIAGNKTVENAAIVGLDNVIVVETDGKSIVAVKRTDVDLDSAFGREMALADNATGAANLAWDADAITEADDEWGISPSEWGVELDQGGEDEDLADEEEEERIVVKVCGDDVGKKADIVAIIKEALRDYDVDIS